MTALMPVLALFTLAFGATDPTVCALTGTELPSATALCPYTGLPAATEAPEPSMSLDFEGTEPVLQPLAGSKVGLAAGEAKHGAACLEIDCRGVSQAGGDLPPGALLPTPSRPVGAVAFWVKAETSAPLALVAVEDDQSAYFAFLFIGGGRWQRVVVDMDSLLPAPDTAPDENGALDPHQIGALILCDPAGFGAMTQPSRLHLFLDDLVLRPEPVRAKPLLADNGIQAGDLSISGLGWMPMGPAAADLVELADEPGTFAARLTRSDATSLCAWIALLPVFGVRGPWLSVEVQVRVESPCRIAIGASEQGGAEYYQVIPVDEAGVWQSVTARADGFSQASDKPDTGNGRLDTDRVLSLAIASLPDEPGAGPWRNVVEIRRVVVVPIPEEGDADPFR